jgi:hypothetical protein
MADEQLRMTAEVVDKFSTPLRKLRDELRGIAAQKVEGDAKLSIDLKGFPRGTAFSTETSGMFKAVHLDRGRQMAETE